MTLYIKQYRNFEKLHSYVLRKIEKDYKFEDIKLFKDEDEEELVFYSNNKGVKYIVSAISTVYITVKNIKIPEDAINNFLRILNDYSEKTEEGINVHIQYLETIILED